MHARRIDNPIVLCDLRIVRGDALHAFEEQPVAHLHDVRLVDRGDTFASVTLRVGERELRDAGGGFERDDLQALDDARHDLVLETGIEVLGVLAHDDEIDVLVARRHTRDVPDGTEIRKELERLAQADVHAGKPASNRRRQRPLERNLVARNRLEQCFRKRRAVLLDGGRAREVRFPFDIEAGGLDDLHDGVGDLRPDAVAGDQCDAMLGHTSGGRWQWAGGRRGQVPDRRSVRFTREPPSTGARGRRRC